MWQKRNRKLTSLYMSDLQTGENVRRTLYISVVEAVSRLLPLVRLCQSMSEVGISVHESL